MILRLVTADGSRKPAVAESVEVGDDGTITGWRSVSAGGVGWFAGRLPEDMTAGVRALVDAATSGPPPAASRRPDRAEEVLELDATGPVSIAGLGRGDDDWTRLALAARLLLNRLTDFPRAAVTVSYEDGARLTHRGTDPLRIDLSAITVTATRWQGHYEPAGDWSGTAEGPGEIEAGPGWAYDVPVALEGGDDTVIHLAADFAILSGTTRIPVRARYEPEPTLRG